MARYSHSCSVRIHCQWRNLQLCTGHAGMGTCSHRKSDIFEARPLDFIRVTPFSHAWKLEVVSFLPPLNGSRAAELPRRWRGQCPRGGRLLARAAWPPAPAEWLGPVADHPLASGRCPRARPPPAASARGQVHAGGAAVAASICSLHSHRPAPRRAPGRWSFGGLSY